ncbi:nucleoside hydrolase [Ornithinibacillus californiensis]|uniref:nucleoside hydrolase n=1 Tax=Ornithinibacillus californiensis TaxID=161536 RepID=UPI000A01A430|nr:nucleoside hydrolase [Ornithinibacillus californiensis]
MKRLPIIIDTDPGIDDAMMLTYAFAHDDMLDIRLVTTCSGNISQSKTNYNARAFLSYIGADVEVARGLEHPIFRELEVAEDIHGESGFGNVQFPAPTLAESNRPAITAMLETIMASNEKVTIVATGPLTNVAALLLAHPEVKPKIERISWMGGAAVGGNMSPTTEFNAHVDPHAVEIVFRSGIPIVMSGLDVTHKAYVTPDEAKRILDIGTEFAEKSYQLVTFYLDMMKKTPFHEGNYDEVLHFHDVCAVMYLLKPDLFEGQDCYVEVALEGNTAGTTVVDYTNKTGKTPNVHVLHTVKREEFVGEFMESVRTISDRMN